MNVLSIRRAPWVIALTCLILPMSALATVTQRKPVTTTSHFVFFSDFDTNLNDALIVAGVARNRDKPELFQSGDEEACFSGLAPSARSGWNLAVDFYAEIISPNSWQDRQQVLLRHELAELRMRKDPRAQRFVAIVRGLMAAAAPAYEECRWKTQDAENRQWLEDLKPRLAEYEGVIAPPLEELYATPWHGLPIRVDLVSTALPVGANTRILTPGGHVLLSTNLVERRDALEVVFHEASHTLVATWRPDPLPKALADAAKSLEMDVPQGLWHVVLFYTTGQTVRRILEEAGEPDYTPYMYTHDLWAGPWGDYRQAVEATWPAYLDGKVDLSTATLELMKALKDRKAENR